jgi:hypothetical protein
MHKTITPLGTTDLNSHTLNFTGTFYVSGSSSDSVISSSAFLINGVDHFFGDEIVANQLARRVYAYRLVDEVEVKSIADCGTVTSSSGKIVLNNFVPTDSEGNTVYTEIKITVKPDSLDIAPKRDQLLSINAPGVIITPEIDTIAVSGSTGSIDYTTTTRFRTS